MQVTYAPDELRLFWLGTGKPEDPQSTYSHVIESLPPYQDAKFVRTFLHAHSRGVLNFHFGMIVQPEVSEGPKLGA